jgi:hypothetical protein
MGDPERPGEQVSFRATSARAGIVFAVAIGIAAIVGPFAGWFDQSTRMEVFWVSGPGHIGISDELTIHRTLFGDYLSVEAAVRPELAALSGQRLPLERGSVQVEGRTIGFWCARDVPLLGHRDAEPVPHIIVLREKLTASGQMVIHYDHEATSSCDAFPTHAGAAHARY